MERKAYTAEQLEEEVSKRLRSLLTIIDERLIVTFSEPQKAIYIGGVKAEKHQLASLKAEAEYYSQSDLWKILHETPKKLAQQAMFVDDGKLDNQLLKGRTILYTLDTQSRILDIFKRVLT